MRATKWGGRRAQRLVAFTLATKGTTCHLCLLPGADTADHDPPRSTLLAAGVLDPDHPDYLWPAHQRPCNKSRQDRTITPELRAELRAKREAALGLGTTPHLSPSLLSRRPSFESPHPSGRTSAPGYLSGGSGKTRSQR